MNYKPYKTLEGDRWDSIAWEQYGDTNKMNLIIDANPNVPTDPVLSSGIILLIPIIEKTDAGVDESLLPPWKRTS